jgi:hypothetical protein
MTLQDLLVERNLTTALVVDDAFDDVPLSEDLEMDSEAWSTFIDDLNDDDKAAVRQAFPGYDAADANDLRGSDEFVEAMWGLRNALRPELWGILFEGYERERTADRLFLQKLEKDIVDLGLTVVKSGRVLPQGGQQCSIIFADLYLGAAQLDPDMDRSIDRLRQLTQGRESDPPVVVLMSRSPLLKDKKAEFRDRANLLGALFRVYAKSDLVDSGVVARVLERFALHRQDAVRVAAFVSAWQQGLAEASKNFLRIIRRLDLPDYCLIREVLLDFEGQPIGSYLLDVFDHLLQHEIEGQQTTIDCAQRLNLIDHKRYPAPYIAGSPDLQEIVFRSIWQHPKRLAVVANDAGIAVSFGDVLVRKSRLDGAAPAEKKSDEPDALIVLTPACDLVRDKNRKVLFLGGKLVPLDQKTWTYESTESKTPIFQLENLARSSVDWNFKDIRLLNHDQVSELVGEAGPYAISLRLRETYSIELQQRLLADMGRVGLTSAMPFTFAVSVDVATMDESGNLKMLTLPSLVQDGGVCIMGRDTDGEQARLTLTETCVDEIVAAVAKITAAELPERSRAALTWIQSSGEFASKLQQGVPFVPGKPNALQPVKIAVTKEAGGEPTVEKVASITRNPDALTKLGTNEQKGCAVVFILTDLEEAPAEATAQAELAEPEDGM